MQVHQPSEGAMLCSTCNESYATVELYKEHYKSDYHRYNIKRKMVKLPPVTPQQFSTKLQQSKNQPSTQFVCNQCRKTFASANTLKQHAQSKGHNPQAMVEHKQKILKMAAVFEKHAKRCLFCTAIQSSLQENEKHMSSQHSFFIAQREYCKNMSGLVEYLQEKIEVGHMCITCQNKGARDFQSADAVRKHMADRGHNFMKIDEGFEEYEKFYDFSPLFEQKLKEQAHIVPGIEFQKVKVIVDEEEANKLNQKESREDDEQEDEEWQDEEGQGDEEWEDESEGEAQGAEVEKQIKQQRKKLKIKTYHIMKPTLTANDELLLPNGKTLGHRKYRHIYRQAVRLPNWFSQQLKMLTNEENQSALSIIAERRELLEAAKAEKLATGSVKRQKKHWLRVGMTNNNLMHHFRCQNSL